MGYNAILIDFFNKIEKVEIDFSDDDNLAKAIDSRGIYTIHTQNILDITSKLGFPVVGFVDRYMEESDRINNVLAAEISGYEYLLSKMILCKKDDSWNFLPLSEGECEALYVYLTTGKVTSSRGNQEGSLIDKFINDYDINSLVIPDLGEPKARMHPKHGNVLVLDFIFDGDPFKTGEELFRFSDILVTKFRNIGEGISLDPNLQYILTCGFIAPMQHYRIAYQAIDSEFETPFVNRDNLNKIFPDD